MSAAVPQTAQRFAERGQAQYRAGRYQEAVEAFRLSLMIEPARPAETLLLASALELSQAEGDFLGTARYAAVLAPLNADAWRLAMHGSLAARRLAAAEREACRHLVLSPGSRDGWIVTARARFMSGQAEDALPALGHARIAAPEDAEIPQALARCLFRLGRLDDALAEIESVEAEGAAGPELAFLRARVLRAAGRMEFAAQLLDQLQAVNPDFTRQRKILELTVTVACLRGDGR